MIDETKYTFAAILQGMLSRIPDTLDKREGSIIYDALAPAAYEISSLYRELAVAFQESFVATAKGEALDKRGAEMGILRRDAVKAVRLAKFYDQEGAAFPLEVGLRFSTLDGEKSWNFTVFQEVNPGVYYLEAEQGGIGGNHYIGELLPIQYIEGLAKAEMVGEPLVVGAEAESDEDYRARYLYKVRNEPIDGNSAQYLQWALEYPGIGKAKVFPLWDGANTVKVSILGTDNMPCSEQLIASFQEYLDPDSEGLGNGVAPLGAKVTVSTASLYTVNVTFNVEIDADKNQNQVVSLLQTALESYFDESAYRKGKVYFMDVGSALLSVDGVDSVTNLKINNGTVDLPLNQEQRPVLGSFTAEVTA